MKRAVLVGIPVAMVAGLLLWVPVMLSVFSSAAMGCGPVGTTSTMPASGLSVATWNVWGDAGGKQGNPLMSRAPYIAQRVKSLHPDLLMMQEASKSKNGPEFQSFMAENTDLKAAGPAKEHRKLFYSSSRLSLLDSGVWKLPAGGSRTAVYAKFTDRRTQKQFVAVSSHLEYRAGARWNKIRISQTRALLRKLNNYTKLPAVLGADLNTSRRRGDGTGALNVLGDAGWVDSSTAPERVNSKHGTAIGTNGVKSRRVTSPGPKAPIDYIYATKGATMHWWALQTQAPVQNGLFERINSDHNIITAGVTLAGMGDGSVATPDAVQASSTQPSSTDAKPASAPTRVGRWGSEQLKNAQAIAAAGKGLNVPERGRIIAIMTAMGESSLKVIDRGDAAGPDSRGLFQQRANGAWGSYSDRMSPKKSSESFYKALAKVPGWQELEPTEAAHRVQRNADPNHYARFWADAKKVYAAVVGASASDLDISTSTGCEAGDTQQASYSSTADCDFPGYKNPNSCTEALKKASKIASTQPCRSNLPGGTWRRWCLAFVAQAYGRQFAGYSTAMDMYRAMKSRGLIHTSKTIPAGALVFFSSSSSAGHVALYNGNGKAWSNDYVRSGCIDLTPMNKMGAGGRYLGWSPPAFPGS